MGNSPAAVLARIKAKNPAWSIRKAETPGKPPAYYAQRPGTGEEVYAGSLGELERELWRRSNGD